MLETKEKAKNIQYIKTFDFIRVLGMIMIFLNHVWAYLPFKIPDLGARGVELFILLSGFLLSYNYFNKINENVTIISNLNFALKHIKKFWVLHILTLFIMLWLTSGFKESNLISILLNIFLLHSWIPNQNYYWGGNGVSWFLSTLFFCYFIFPFIIKIIKKIDDNVKILFTMISTILLIVLFQTIYISFNFYESGYILHIFPLYKVVEFFVGCLAGILFLKNKDKILSVNIKNSLAVIISICLYIFVIILCDKLWIRGIFLIFELFFIIILASSSSNYVINKLISNRVIKYLGGISFEFYLIHHVVIIFYGNYLSYFFRNFDWYIDVLVMFFISFIFSLLYRILYNFIIKLLKKNENKFISLSNKNV